MGGTCRLSKRHSKLGQPMSALGHKRTLHWSDLMSALPPKADIAWRRLDVRFVPKADSCTAAILSLFDHLVGAAGQGQWHGNAKRLSGLQIDVQLDFGCLLNR
jgi:hypothetical protein